MLVVEMMNKLKITFFPDLKEMEYLFYKNVSFPDKLQFL